MPKDKQLRSRRYWIIVIILSVLLFVLIWRLGLRRGGTEAPLFQAVPPTSGLVAGWPRATFFLEASDTSWMAPAVLPASLRRDLLLYRKLWRGFARSGYSTEHPFLLFLQLNGPEGPALGILATGARAEWLREELRVSATARTQYRGQPVTTVQLEGGGQLTFTQYQNMLVVGRFPFLVEEVIGHLTDGRGEGTLQKAETSLAGASLTIWLNEDVLNRNWPGTADFWPRGWLRIELDTSGEFRTLGGRFFADSNEALPWLEGTTPAQPGAILNAIPAQLSYVEWRHYEQPEDGFGSGIFAEAFRSVAGAEQVYAAQAPPGANAATSRFWMVALQDRTQAAERLDSLARRVGTLEDYFYQTYRIRRLLTGAIRPGKGRMRVESPYCVFLDDYLLVSNSRSGLELWLDQYLASATLVRSDAFLEFYKDNDQPAQAWWLLRPPLLDLPRGGAPLRNAFLQLLSKQPFFGLPWSGAPSSSSFRTVWKKGDAMPGEEAQSRIAWQFRLDAEALAAPQLLPTGESVPPLFAIQDKAHQLYLLDAAGRELWRKPLESPVISTFHLIDYYQDGRQQLLFNTPGAIHLVDLEKGENTGIFPIELSSPATNGLTVVDTSGYGGYAFFVANSNGHLYGFDREGLPLQGWDPLLLSSEVQYPMLHFQEATRDFFVALDTAGTLHVFRRNGAYRFPPLVFNDTFPNPPDYQLHPQFSRIVACNQDGVAYVINLAGNHFPLRLESRPRRPVQFAFADVTGDDRKDYLTLNRGRLAVHYYQGNNFRRAFTFQADRPLTDVFAVDLPGSVKAGVGSVDDATGKIYLIDERGKLLPGFPLAGRTRFSVVAPATGDDPLLVVADGRTVYGYEVVVGAVRQ